MKWTKKSPISVNCLYTHTQCLRNLLVHNDFTTSNFSFRGICLNSYAIYRYIYIYIYMYLYQQFEPNEWKLILVYLYTE